MTVHSIHEPDRPDTDTDKEAIKRTRQLRAREMQIYWTARTALANRFGYRAVGLRLIPKHDAKKVIRNAYVKRLIALSSFVAAISILPSSDGETDRWCIESAEEFDELMKAGAMGYPNEYAIDGPEPTLQELQECFRIIEDWWIEIVKT